MASLNVIGKREKIVSSDSSSEQLRNGDENIRREILREWDSLLNELFPTATPTIAKWEQLDDVLAVLNHIIDVKHQVFLPISGCSDLKLAPRARENNCIELHLHSRTAIVHPVSLEFHNTGLNEWSYFRLQTEALLATNIYEETEYENAELPVYENLLEFNGEYYDFDANDEGDLGNNEEVREVTRCLFDGDYLIFSMGSFFNWHLDVSARINGETTPEQFHAFILNEVQQRTPSTPLQ